MASLFFSKDFLFKISFLIKGHKRLVFLCLGFIMFCIYSIYMLFPVNYSFGFTKEYVETSSLDVCINDRIKSYSAKIDNLDAVRYDDVSQLKYFSFIGNGYFGISTEAKSSIIIRYNKGLSLETQIYPFISLSVPDYRHKESTILDFLAGELINFQCYKQSSLCISITSKSYAHRTRPELFVQEIRVHNPTKSAIQIAVHKNNKNIDNLKIVKKATIIKLEFEIGTRNVTVKDDSNTNKTKTYVVVFGRPIFPRYLSIPLTGDNSFIFISGIKYQVFIGGKDVYHETLDMLINGLERSLVEAYSKPIKQLRFEHEVVWKSLWNTGISTDWSLAPGAINGNQINSTIYYLLSNSQAFMNIHNISKENKTYRESFMYKASHCYNTHDTLYVKNLWTFIVTQSDFLNQTNKWRILLRKYGCGLLIRAGAQGLIQAIVYSAGSFNFVGDHISFGMHPNDLQRRLHFRNLFFKDPNSVKFNVLIDLDSDNRPQLWVSSSDTKKTLYACDAACVDDPVVLKKTFEQLPVKITVPRHPILYISDQVSHILDLKEVLHFGQIEDAKAHNHKVISLHKHGHSWGGLPPIFWVFIILLVLFFHLFLCKIIYSEYCRYKDDYDFSINDSKSVDSYSSRLTYLPSTRRTVYYKGYN